MYDIASTCPACCKCRADEVALVVHVLIDLVGDGIFRTLILLDADVVSTSTHPHRLVLGSLGYAACQMRK